MKALDSLKYTSKILTSPKTGYDLREAENVTSSPWRVLPQRWAQQPPAQKGFQMEKSQWSSLKDSPREVCAAHTGLNSLLKFLNKS